MCSEHRKSPVNRICRKPGHTWFSHLFDTQISVLTMLTHQVEINKLAGCGSSHL